jgi:hypothetical protein
MIRSDSAKASPHVGNASRASTSCVGVPCLSGYAVPGEDGVGRGLLRVVEAGE